MRIEENVPLSAFTTFRIGGRARFFVRVTSVEALQQACHFGKENNLPILILGGGSNMLIDDAGFPGLAIKIEIEGIEYIEEQTVTTVIAGAGESWDGLVKSAVIKKLWGIENLSGIPGTVGASPVQNIGAYGVELKHSFLWAEVLEIASLKLIRLQAHECAFSYRSSIFKREQGRFVIVRVALQLQKSGMPNLTYTDLSKAHAAQAIHTLEEVRDAVLKIRAVKFPDINVEGTAGSFFMNPVLSSEQAKQLAKKFPGVPQFITEAGVKVSLAWILDHALHLKGQRMGRARLFESQPLVVVTEQSATCTEVLLLADFVIKKIKTECAIEVEKEVRYIK